VTQQQLDLLKLAARGPAKLRASASQIVRGDTRYANLCCILPEHLPDDLLAQTLAGEAASAIHRPEHLSFDSATLHEASQDGIGEACPPGMVGR